MAADLCKLDDKRLFILQDKLEARFGGSVASLGIRLCELTVTVLAEKMLDVFAALRDDPDFQFELLIDLCGIDYSTYGSDISEGGAYLADEAADNTFPRRFAAVYHLLSVTHNVRLRVRVFAEDDAMPMLETVTGIWPSASWYEREAFDLYGIIFTGRPFRSAPYPDRLRFCRQSIPQGLSTIRNRRDALRPGVAACGIPAGKHRVA